MARENRGQSFENNTRSAEFSYNPEKPPPRKDSNLFGWTVFILLLIGFAICCWVFSFYVFGHPEKPFSYAILAKLRKLEAPKRFEITAAPEGEFLNAQQLWDKYNNMTNRELGRESEKLLRNYLRNYKLTGEKVPYVIGSFNILDSYELGDANLFSSGVVALAQATDAPQVLLEHVFTGDKRVIPVLHRMLLTGLNLRFDRTVDLSAVVNVSRLKDGRLRFTAVPLLYGSYTTSTGAGTFSLEPPTSLNISAGLPVVSQTQVEEATEKLVAHRSRARLDPAESTSAVPRPQMQLVRVERPKPVAENAPPFASPTPLPEDAPVLPAIPVKSPESTPPMAAAATPSAKPTATPLQPFLSPTPGSIATTAGGKWPTYAPGQMPRGRLANVPDMSELAGRGVGGERIYLQGSFVVTASGQDRAVLRSQTSLPEDLGGARSSTTRIIVEFPSGSRPPSEGSTLSRDSRRPFLVTEVRKTSDGQVNVYAREVTRAQ
ncbi:MAG TPA: hypothetical protein VFO90_06720 [Terrimicrobiaceae bacterium]|nr:hypothetical protein [Terrimicrobiaceae bacterium]